MRIVYFGNNRLGLEVLKWLVAKGEIIVGLGLHPPEKRAFGEEFLKVASLPPERILHGESIHSKETIDRLCEMRPDIILSVLFGYILPPHILQIPNSGCINLHPAYLPYNRGAYPNVWSIVEGTPAGVTLHYMDKGIDTGSIISQREVPVSPVDTGETLYRKLEQAGLELFQETWPRIREGRVTCLTQHPGEGTYHRTRDVEKIDRIDLNAAYTGKEIVDILRARTCPPYKGAYFEVDGRRIYVRLELRYKEDL